MVYIGNIITAIQSLTPETKVVLCYRSGNRSIVYYGDKIEKSGGDLKITRISRKGDEILCIFYVDCAEIEEIIVNGDIL